MMDEDNRAYWDLERQVQHDHELRERRRQWEQQRAYEQEQERVADLRSEMNAYREQRLTDWMEHGGDPATFSQVWPQMMKDYLDGKQLARDAERLESFEDVAGS
jgi:hypothetical protein